MMTRTPDEIKKGLECCIDGTFACEGNCVFDDDVHMFPDCIRMLMTATLALIQQLQDDNAQQARCIENMTDKLNAMNDEVAKLQAERDAAVGRLKQIRDCERCKNYPIPMQNIPCLTCTQSNNCFEWRGVTKDG